MTSEHPNPYVGEARIGAPCCVKNPHAGGQCPRSAAVAVYGLHFCAEHGQQVADGALEEAQHDAEAFLDGFRHHEARPLPVLVSRAIEAGSAHVFAHEGDDFYEVLFRAFPEPTPEVRGLVEEAEASDEPGYEAFADTLIGSLHTMHRCMRIAYEEREVWLLELLEGERQSIAAQCAYAVRDSPRQIEAALERSRERCEERDGLRPAG